MREPHWTCKFPCAYLSLTARQPGENSKGNFAGAEKARGKRQPPLAFVAVRALFGIELLGGHAEHVVALDAHAVQHSRSGRRDGFFLRPGPGRRGGIHSRAFYHAARKSRCRARLHLLWKRGIETLGCKLGGEKGK